MAEGRGGTSFWKVFFGVLAAIAVAGGCIIGACVLLVGKAAINVAESERTRQEYRANMKVTLKEFVRERDYAYVRGSVTNDGERTVQYWKIAARFLDTNGAVVDTAFTNALETLGPDESKNFQIMHRWDPRFSRATLQVEEVRVGPSK